MGKQRIYFIFYPFSLNLIHIYCIFCLKLLHFYFLYEVLLFMKHQYCHCFRFHYWRGHQHICFLLFLGNIHRLLSGNLCFVHNFMSALASHKHFLLHLGLCMTQLPSQLSNTSSHETHSGLRHPGFGWEAPVHMVITVISSSGNEVNQVYPLIS